MRSLPITGEPDHPDLRGAGVVVRHLLILSRRQGPCPCSVWALARRGASPVATCCRSHRRPGRVSRAEPAVPVARCRSRGACARPVSPAGAGRCPVVRSTPAARGSPGAAPAAGEVAPRARSRGGCAPPSRPGGRAATPPEVEDGIVSGRPSRSCRNPATLTSRGTPSPRLRRPRMKPTAITSLKATTAEVGFRSRRRTASSPPPTVGSVGPSAAHAGRARHPPPPARASARRRPRTPPGPPM